MRVQDFLDISSFDKYIVVNEKGCVKTGDILDKYNTMKECGLDKLIKIKPMVRLVKDRISVVCVLKIVSDIEEKDVNCIDDIEL